MFNPKKKLKKDFKLWRKAQKLIPGGNMLYSKNPDRFLKNFWPPYFSKAAGCNIWTLNNERFLDFSVMGVGTNILGYGNKFVDNAVKKIVKKGNLSTLNCPEEVSLAEKLIKMHPWSDMVRFARTGGEANSIAIRIARAAIKKHNVAFCGYHGWHDWYLSSNLNKKNKIEGFKTKGVPNALKNTSFPFEYGDIKGLKNLIKLKNIGIIKMEFCRNTEPDIKFLRTVRSLANRKKIILIFDECTSGFRENFGGLHMKYGIFPDMAIFGKALGNGYAITAVIGKRKIMKNTKDTFLSSTFWTERIGPAAALATLNEMKKTKSWLRITKIGKFIRNEIKKIAKKNNINIQFTGIPSLTRFTIISKKNNSEKYKELITQEMLKEKILSSDVIYFCIKHNKTAIKRYLKILSKIFKIINECEEGKNLKTYLRYKSSIKLFKRLN